MVQYDQKSRKFLLAGGSTIIAGATVGTLVGATPARADTIDDLNTTLTGLSGLVTAAAAIAVTVVGLRVAIKTFNQVTGKIG